MKTVLKGKIYSLKEEKPKPKASRREEMIKIKEEIKE